VGKPFASLIVFSVLLAGGSMTGQAPSPTSDPDPGISEALAHERAAVISNLRYDLSFTIPPARASAIAGRETIAFTLGNNSAPLTIDFAPNQQGRVRRVEIDGQEHLAAVEVP